jgi:hypothetical protein
MTTIRLILVIFILYFALLITGCVTFKSDMVGQFTSPAVKNIAAEPVTVLFNFSHIHQTRGLDAIPKLEKQYERIDGFDDIFIDALKEFSNIKSFDTFTDYAGDVNDQARRVKKDSMMQKNNYVIKMQFMREKSFAPYFLGILTSSVSLSIIPVPYTNSYSVTADVYHSKGQLLKNYTRSASLTKWIQTMLIVIYPFFPEQRKKEELYVQFMHDIFKQIETDKILKKM